MTDTTLADLGWSEAFARQLTAGEETLKPMRVAEVHRDRLRALGSTGDAMLIPSERAGAYAVGDWVLSDGTSALRRLDPATDLMRKAAGHTVERQRIAANIDTIAVVTSCNADFNLARLERYLALIASAGCLPLVVLTKADLVEDADDYRRQAEKLSPLVTALALNAKDMEDAGRLTAWCGPGRTLALVGSSGVGKTTLRNALTEQTAATAGIREDDAKGRHTTTFRSLVRTRAGGWLIDTPGMRELQLADAQDGIGEVFDDITEIAAQCRFNDCAHDTEPGCAIRAALDAGHIDPDRLKRWQKLMLEDRYNSESLSQARSRQKAFGKMVKGGQARGRQKRNPGR